MKAALILESGMVINTPATTTATTGMGSESAGRLLRAVDIAQINGIIRRGS